MPNEKKGIWKAVGYATAIVGLIAAILGLWWNIETRFDKQIKSAVLSSTQLITEEIQRSSLDIVELHKDDLVVRIRILKREIEEYERRGEQVPERKRIELEALEDQLEEVKEKWYR